MSRRTVHFYVQRRLLPPPEGLGRTAHYTDHHLARRVQIKGWQEQGIPLEEIRARLSGAAERRRRPDPGPVEVLHQPGARPVVDVPGLSWFRQPLVAGFELHVASGRQPLTAAQLAALARALGEILDNGGAKQ